jgi:hypothetical protein
MYCKTGLITPSRNGRKFQRWEECTFKTDDEYQRMLQILEDFARHGNVGAMLGLYFNEDEKQSILSAV